MNMTDEDRLAYYPKFFQALLKASLMNDAIVLQDSFYTASCILMPPGRSPINPSTTIQAGIVGIVLTVGFTGVYRMLCEIPGRTDALKKKELGDADFYYLYVIATHSERRGTGMGSKLLQQAQERASNDNLPIWLEASTEGSKRLYERNGFRVVGEINVGRGKADNMGRPKEGGKGITMWAMIWRPELDVKKGP